MHTAGRKHRIINIVACADATDSELANAIDREARRADAKLLRQGRHLLSDLHFQNMEGYILVDEEMGTALLR